MEQSLDHVAQPLLAYLRAQLHEPTLDYVAPPTQLHGGFETLVYRFQLQPNGAGLHQPLILRLYPPRFGAGNAVRESIVQTVLADHGYPAPRAHLVCTEMDVLGGTFFIMDCLPGEPLARAPLAAMPELLGQTQAALHGIHPAPLLTALAAHGLDRGYFQFAGRLADVQRRAAVLPWLHAAIKWLVAEQPSEPPQPSVCHGDFHPFNVLAETGKVTAVLDWPGFLVGDPAQDVATTLVLLTIPVKHSGAALGINLTDAMVDEFTEQYLAAYQAARPLDQGRLDYYRVARCVAALIEGAEGHAVWQQPAVVADLRACVEGVTGITIAQPEPNK
jgi:aminoglycoside phosphotransferase (APT) family kinase protein